MSDEQQMSINDNNMAASAAAPAYRKPIIAGVAITVGFVATFGAWAAFAPIVSAVIAPGVVRVEGQRKTIQHLEGGIVSEILVRDGERVEQGQVLVRLDDTQPQANLKLLRGRFLVAKALEARLMARRDDLPVINFPKVLRGGDANEIAPILAGQVRIFQARTNALNTETSILNRRIFQLDEEISGLQGQIRSSERQLVLIRDELSVLLELLEKGLTRRDRILVLQRNVAEIEGNQSRLVADVARAGQKITETQLQIDGLRTNLMNDVVQLLSDTRKELFDLAQRMVSLEDILSRTEVQAPLAGTVVDLAVHSIRGVVAPGARLLDIVPKIQSLVVEVKVQPIDIDIVRVELSAEVRFTAFDTSTSTPVEGIVKSVSADRLTDDLTGADYFLARVEVTGELDDALNGAELLPGMQAEVMIQTGERTPLDYLISPVSKSLQRAMREQ